MLAHKVESWTRMLPPELAELSMIPPPKPLMANVFSTHSHSTKELRVMRYTQYSCGCMDKNILQKMAKNWSVNNFSISYCVVNGFFNSRMI